MRWQASYEAIYGYVPNSKVTDHNAIDLDQAAIEEQLAETTPDYTTAKAIYLSGGHSKSYAEFTFAGTTPAFTTAAKCAGTAADGTALTGMSLKSDVSAGTGKVFQCVYPTSTVQATYQNCAGPTNTTPS